MMMVMMTDRQKACLQLSLCLMIIVGKLRQKKVCGTENTRQKSAQFNDINLPPLLKLHHRIQHTLL